MRDILIYLQSIAVINSNINVDWLFKLEFGGPNISNIFHVGYSQNERIQEVWQSDEIKKNDWQF